MQATRHLGRPDRLGPGAPDRGGRRHRRRSSGAAPTRHVSSSPHAPSGPISPPRSRLLGGWPTLMCQVLTTRARDQGSRPPPSLLAQTLDKDLQAPEPSWPPTPGSLPSHAAPAHRSVVSTSPTAATRGSSAPCSCPPSPHCAPPPPPGSTTSANATKTKRLGPGRPHPGPPPLDTPHRSSPV